MLRALGLAAVLGGLWLLLSGHFEAWLLWLALASVAGVVFLAHRMDVADHEGFPIHLTPATLTYYPWLFLEIIKSNFSVAKAVLGGPEAIAPSVFRVPLSQDSDVGRVTYANSITLTPGTVSIGLDETGVLVHALTRDSRAGLETGEMDRRVSAMTNTRSGETATPGTES